MVLDEDGRTLYLTGLAYNFDTTTTDATTIAYDGATGNLLWEARTPPGYGYYGPRIATSRGVVYIAFTVANGPPPQRATFVTIAYDAVNGAELWRQSFTNDRLARGGSVTHLAVDGVGGIYVTGSAGLGDIGPGDSSRYITVKYTQDDFIP
jgi:outer membrane protein assembly factor BamB